MPDIIFIGAGPIGLLGAIQLKLQCPEKTILMFEKYEVPMRRHAMYVQKSSFAGMDRRQGFGEILDSIDSKVLISDLEIKLREYAQSIGIVIKYKAIESFEALKQDYPDTNYFVGSGGLRGIIHPQVFHNENQINESLRYAVEVKYKAIGEAKALSLFSGLSGVLANTNHVVSEYVGHLKDGLTPISLRIFIDKPTFEAMKEATFKNPYTLNDVDRIPDDLYKTITTYLAGRKNLAAETLQEDSLKISSITLSIYASKDFCKVEDGKVIFQIGEEAFACPFYRSFNDNASCIPDFTKAIKALFDNVMVEQHISSSSLFKVSYVKREPLLHYQHEVQKLVTREIVAVHALNTGLKMIDSSVASSQLVPELSYVKLSMTQNGRNFLEDIKGDKPAKDSGCSLF